MAKTISDEQMKLTMIINGDSAQKEINDLEKATIKLKNSNSDLAYQRKLVKKQLGEESAEYKKLTKDINKNSLEIEGYENKLKSLISNLKLTDRTMEQLRNQSSLLTQQLKLMDPNSADFKKYSAELSDVKTRMGELSGKAAVAKSSVSSLADGFNRYQALAVSFIATLTGVVLSIQKIIDINGKLSDAQADVMKTTRMSKDEVDELTKSFGLLKTRTQRIDLLGIAKVAGELNIAKSEVGAFVKVMNKAGVSLGDSFEGGAEEVATKLGKIKTLYEELKDAKVELAFESVGSALNDLGADGNATAANISDFVTRVGTLAKGLKPTISEALGLGAAFEETGLNAEIAGNNYGKLLRIAARDTPKFAQFMKMTNAEATKLINTDPTEFFLKFTEAFSKIKDETKKAGLLDSLKLNDNEVGMVINAAADNTTLFRQKIDLATASLNKATSMTEEFNIKNTNLAATLEKIKKTTTGWFSSDTFVSWLTTAVTWLANLIGASDDADGSVQRLRDRFIFMIKILAIVITSYISYNTAVKLTSLWTSGLATATQILNAIQNRGAVVTGILRNAQLLLAAAYYTITGNTVRATAAMRLFNASASANPLGLVLVAVMAVVTALVLFSKETSKASKVQQMQADIQNEVAKSISKEKNEVEALVKVIQDETVSKDKKLAAIKRLNEISPEYLKGLTLENSKTLEGKKILDRYIDSLYKKARATAVVNKMDKLDAEKLDAEGKTAGDYKKEQTFGFLHGSQFDEFKTRKDFDKYVKTTYAGKSKAQQKQMVDRFISTSGFADKEKHIKDIEAQQNALKPEYEKNLVENLVTKVDTTSPDKTPIDTPVNNRANGSNKNPNSTPQEISKRKLDEEAKTKADLLALDREYQDDKLAFMADGAAKELLIEQQRYLREIYELEKKKVHTEELAKLDEDIAKAKESGDKSELNRLLLLRQGWDEKNQAFDDKINGIKEGKLKLHNVKLGIIQEKAAKELLDKDHETYEQGKLNRETAFNNELAGLNLTEAQKQKRKEEFNAKELVYDKEYLNSKLDELNRIMAGEVINGIDFSLLSPEAKEKIKKDAELVQNAISKIQNEKPNPEGKKELDLGIGGGDKDILGFSQDQWDNFFTNIGNGTIGVQTMTMALMAATAVFAELDKFATASENASLKKSETNSNKKKATLKRQLDSGIISQTQYNKKVEKIDEELDAKKADLEYKQAKRQRMISAANIIMSTAQAIIGIWAQFPKADFGITAGIMSGVVGALGALQLATVLATPLPAKGHEEGLYPEYVKRQQDGKTFKSKYQGKTRSGMVNETSHFLVAENGPEMVIDNKAWREMDPAVKEALVRNLQGIKGWENGKYNKENMRYEVPAPSTSPASSGKTYGDTELLQMVLAVITENTAVMKDLRDKGVIGKFFKNDLQSAKNIQESISDYNDLRNKSKK